MLEISKTQTTMAHIDHEEKITAPTITANMSSKKDLLSSALKRTSEWIFSQEIPSDVSVRVGEASFSLHKFPLVSKCGYFRKLVSDDAEISVIELSDVPGGAEAFELAAKFCYGINFEIRTENIAMLRCMSEYLLMTEEYAVGNLVGRTDAYLNEVALKSLAGAVSVLHAAESFLLIAEELKLVGRCIDAISYMTCKDSQFCSSGRSDSGNESLSSSAVYQTKHVVDWWGEDLTVLRIDIFQRVVIAMMARGFKQYALGPILMLYAEKSLRGLALFGKGQKKIKPRQEHEKRVVLETIVSLLPREKNTMSVSFLSMLLRSAKLLETTVACQVDLEKRMGLQLAQAVLDDLLIPSYSYNGDALLDVETVQRIMMNYLECHMDRNHLRFNVDDEHVSPPKSDLERVGRLMENYLVEIATDRSLSVSKFTDIAVLIPEQSRITEDAMYRAVDIYLKAHPSLSDMEKKKVCSVMECQKLSREACAHAAQNDQLPVQTVVQVLYYEQKRLRDVVDGGAIGSESTVPAKVNNLFSTDIRHHVPDELSNLRRQNEELKMELLKMKMKLKEIETSSMKAETSSPKGDISVSSDKSPVPRKSFINSISKKLGKFSPFRISIQNPKSCTKPAKIRRHSIS